MISIYGVRSIITEIGEVNNPKQVKGPTTYFFYPEIPNASFAAYIQQRFSFTTEFPLPLFRGRQLDRRERNSLTGNKKSSLIWERGNFHRSSTCLENPPELFSNLECLVRMRVWGSYAN
ncbi:hypothetical protein CDAR_374011 [Caerostris darwini]|uniref:Ycf15 n=1 Tax=Caerostris darwini TaxID=1538125 RepID=A0AAV4PNN5_9ARAC|nr:hypothetical protein CDAR_374011 [Caerostris darwini]